MGSEDRRKKTRHTKKRKARNQKCEENSTTHDEVDVDVNVDVVDPEKCCYSGV